MNVDDTSHQADASAAGARFHIASAPHDLISVYSYQTDTTLQLAWRDVEMLADALKGLRQSGGLGLIVVDPSS